ARPLPCRAARHSGRRSATPKRRHPARPLRPARVAERYAAPGRKVAPRSPHRAAPARRSRRLRRPAAGPHASMPGWDPSMAPAEGDDGSAVWRCPPPSCDADATAATGPRGAGSASRLQLRRRRRCLRSPAMRLLYHFCLQPFSREVRVVLREKALDFTLRDERPGRVGEDLLALHPAGDLPVLVEPDGLALADSRAI